MTGWHLLFFGASALVFHSYVLFPWQMKRLGRQAGADWEAMEEFPTVDVLLSAYNEAAVIEAKIRSIFASHYPKHKIKLWLGTDACTDDTDAIVARLCAEYPNLIHRPFAQRTGKPAIINALAALSSAEIIIVTDADALFEPQTIAELVHPFVNEQVGGVQANAVVHTTEGDTVARQEASYTAREMEIKAGEGRWGCVIGGFGAAYALRRKLFRPVPKGFIVDDFFSFADISSQGYQTVFQAQAITHLQVSADVKVQFRRKRRIGKGNFQNLAHFRSLLNPFQRIGYVYWSHKVLRWLTPFLIGLAYLATVSAGPEAPLLWYAFLIMSAAFLVALLDLALQAAGISLKALRFLSHFLLMNIALLLGFIDSWKNDGTVSWNNQTQQPKKNPVT